MIKNNRNNEQIYGRNDMIMLDPNNKIYGSLGIADKYVMKTEEGTRLMLRNPKLGKFGDVLTEFNMYGRSEQNKTTGKNLLKYPYVEANITSSGITFKDNKDGSISVSGTATGAAYYNLYSNIDGKRLTLASGTYKLVVKGRSKSTIVMSNDVVTAINQGTFTITDGHNEIYCYIVTDEGLTVDETIYPMIQLASITDESYEPYTGGIPSPSPDYPQEIKSVGDSGNIEVNVMGANVLEGTKLGVKSTVNGITYTAYENGILITGTATKDFIIVLHDDTIHPLTHGTYYLTTSGLNSSVTLNFYYVGKFVDDRQNLKVTFNKDVEYSLRLQISKGATINTTVQVSLTKSEITSYEPYYEEQTVTLPYTLNAIPVSSGGNYIDQSGQQWIADYVDLHRGVKVQRIYNIDVDGENVKFEQVGDYANIISRGLPIALYNRGQKVFATSTFTSSSWFFNTANGQFLYLIGADISDKINESCKKQLGKIHYVLATPIETDLMPEEIEQYKKLSTKTPTTIVENNYNTWMKATYKSIESV